MTDAPQVPKLADSAEDDHRGRASIAALERWEAFGGHWRTKSLSSTEAAVELLTCSGTPEDVLRSGEPSLLAFLARKPHSGGEPEDELQRRKLSPRAPRSAPRPARVPGAG